MKVREIKNGRLAMIAFLGFTGQYLATKKGPVDNLIDHLKVRLPLHRVSVPNGALLSLLGVIAAVQGPCPAPCNALTTQWSLSLAVAHHSSHSMREPF